MGNVVVFIDEKGRKLKILNRETVPNEYREFDFASLGLDFKDIFAAAFGENTDGRIDSATCVLPDELILYDLIKTPVFFGKSQKDLLKFEISTRYPQHELYKKLYVPMAKANGQMSTVVFMTLSERVENIKNAFKVNRMILRGVTFESAAIADAYLSVDTKRRGSTLLVVVKQDYTKVLVIKDRSLLFFTTIPFGRNILEIGTELKSAPSVLNHNELEPKGKKSQANNSRYLIRTLMEMRSILSEKYRLPDIAIKYCVNKKFSELFNGYEMEFVSDMPQKPEFFVSNNKGMLF